MATIEAIEQVTVVEATSEVVTVELGAPGSLTVGTGLTGGGPFSSAVTVALNAQSIASLALADSALQPGANISELVNDAGYSTLGTDVLAINLPAGATNNITITPLIGFLELNANVAASNVTGIQAGFDGQIITVTSRNAANNVTLNRLHAGSDVANRLRLSADLALFQDQGISLRYSSALALWIPMS